MKSGIYSIINKENGKRYIGQTINFTNRFSQHRAKLTKGNHENSLLQKAWNKYGESNFEFKIMEYVKKESLTEREQWWMDLFGSYLRDYGYNLNPLANQNPMLGRNHTAESKVKISKKAKGRKLSEDNKKKLIESRKGRPCRANRKPVSAKNNPRTSYTAKWTYYLKSPDGLEYITNNIGNFCRDNLLTRTHLTKCVVDNTYYKGWSGYRVPFNPDSLINNNDIGEIK